MSAEPKTGNKPQGRKQRSLYDKLPLLCSYLSHGTNFYVSAPAFGNTGVSNVV